MDQQSNFGEDIIFYSWLATFDEVGDLNLWAQQNNYSNHPLVLTRLAELRAGIIFYFDVDDVDLHILLEQPEQLVTSDRQHIDHINDLFETPQQPSETPVYDMSSICGLQHLAKSPRKRKLSVSNVDTHIEPVSKVQILSESSLAEEIQAFTSFQDLEHWAFQKRLLNDPKVQERLVQLGGSLPSDSGSGGSGSTDDMTGGRDVAPTSDLDDLLHHAQLDPIDLEDLNELNDYLGKPYTIVKKGEKTFKNLVKDVSYKVKLNNDWEGSRLKDIRNDLLGMFEDVLSNVRENLTDQDKGRVIINHGSLHDPIAIPLQHLGNMNGEVIMATIEKVLQSHEELMVDDTFDITVGTIEVPKGGRGRRITQLQGENNSIHRKKSMIEIVNDDYLCLARALVVGEANLANLKNIHKRKWKHLIDKKRYEQRKAAVDLHRKADVPFPHNMACTVEQIPAFEAAMNVQVVVFSAVMGNRVIYVGNEFTNKKRRIYLYHSDKNGGHFDVITSVTGFLGREYFCEHCLPPYTHREKHSCEDHCRVCKSDNCPVVKELVCHICNMTCRSQECYVRHQETKYVKKGPSKGEKISPSCDIYHKCVNCTKVINIEQRPMNKHICGEWTCNACQEMVVGNHMCYLRREKAKDVRQKFIFYDFETDQSAISECEGGYEPQSQEGCDQCQNHNSKCSSCIRCRHCKQSWCGHSQHIPNFVVAHTACAECINTPVQPDAKCMSCGTRCMVCGGKDPKTKKYVVNPCEGTCGFREVTFQGPQTQSKFGQWLFSEHHQYFTAIAHNSKGYDGYFLLDYLMSQSMTPYAIYQGSKIMYLHVGHQLNIRLIDSLNFLPMRLASLPKAFGFAELTKGWFPHYFNVKDNQTYKGDYPAPHFYGVDYMSTPERADFMQWYDSKSGEIFDFQQEMLAYCRSDVDILRQACLKFRQQMLEVTGTQTMNEKSEITWVGAVDPFNYTTIASLCLGLYHSKFFTEDWRVKVIKNDKEEEEELDAKLRDGKLSVWFEGQWCAIEEMNETFSIKEKTFVSSPIAKDPRNGYTADQYSKVSILWLKWVEHQLKQNGSNVSIQHALNGHEKKVIIDGRTYRLDGFYIDHDNKKIALEFHGCIFHGCQSCYPHNRQDIKHPKTGQTMNVLYTLTKKKQRALEKAGYIYQCMWECEFHKDLQSNTHLQEFVKDIEVQDRLNPRDSFFGGRTNASKLHYKVKGEEKIKYVDFTSLYPWTNKYCRYPVGHPEIITQDFGNIKEYFGIAKVKILPPRGLYHPVLPLRSNGKLKFPLCRTCADTESLLPCECTENDRAITGTWCTPEIEKSLEKGYRILKVYEVWHWVKSTQYDPSSKEGGLFTEYIDTFLKLKQQASGWPDWCKTSHDRQKYISQYAEHEGIHLDPQMIVKNPGMRSLAKLCLNSFWGKFGQRSNMRQTKYIHSSELSQLINLITDKTKEVIDFHIISEDILHVEWQHTNDFTPESNKTNIFIATFTTCWARLKLYETLDSLGERVLYYDTDSVIYVSQPGLWDAPLGDNLGDLTDELDGHYIVEYCAGGPKNYAYRLDNGKEVCKVRGFTLNFTNSQKVNFAAIKEMVFDQSQTITLTNPHKITRHKCTSKVYNRVENKKYGMVYTKRVILPSMDTLPFGY